MTQQQDVIAAIRAKMAAIERGETLANESDSTDAASNATLHRASIRSNICTSSNRLRSQVAGGNFDAEVRRPFRFSSISNKTRTDSNEARRKEKPLDRQAAMRKIERLCSMREQASSSLRQRLIRDGFPEDIASDAVQRALDCGLVDDSRYADALVRSRLAAGKGRAGIARELNALGIDPYGINAFVEAEELGDDIEIDRAVRLIERKPPHAKNARDAAYRRLVGKGFSSSVASSAARIWWESAQQER